MTVHAYLDCGCSIMWDGSRAWCPSCLNPPPAKKPAVRKSRAGGSEYYTIELDSGAVYMQRASEAGPSDFPLLDHEKAIIALCERILNP